MCAPVSPPVVVVFVSSRLGVELRQGDDDHAGDGDHRDGARHPPPARPRRAPGLSARADSASGRRLLHRRPRARATSATCNRMRAGAVQGAPRTTVVRPHRAYVTGPTCARGLGPRPGTEHPAEWKSGAAGAPERCNQRTASTRCFPEGTMPRIRSPLNTGSKDDGLLADIRGRQHPDRRRAGRAGTACAGARRSRCRSSTRHRNRGRKPRSSPWSSSLVVSAFSLNARVPAGSSALCSLPRPGVYPEQQTGKRLSPGPGPTWGRRALRAGRRSA